jgi:hypothetical protein
MSRSKEPIHCPFHEGKWSDKEPCVPPGASCGVIGLATLLQDRLDVIAALAEEARTSYLQNADVMPGVSVSAALETVRLLARSITEDEELRDGAFTVPGDDRALLMVLRQNPRPLPTGGGGEELHLTPKTRPTRPPGSARKSEGGRPGSASVPAPTVAN